MMFDHVKNFNLSIYFLISIFDSDSEPGYIYIWTIFSLKILMVGLFSLFMFMFIGFF